MKKVQMRRHKQLLSEESIKEILNFGSNGILSLVNSEGDPYGVPINYVYDGKKSIYFHCAKVGHKIDCIKINNRCSFCVVGQDLIIPHEFTSYFRSVIVKGTINVVNDISEKRRGLLLLCSKYSAGVNPRS